MSRVSLASLFLFTGASSSIAAPPVIFTHTPPPGEFWTTSSVGYVDIEGTEKVVTVPAGTAIFTWHLHASTGTVRIRPAIGSQSPTEGMLYPSGFSGPISGSWATPVTAGTITVRLQVAGVEGFGYDPTLASSWTLVVFPESEAAAPAVAAIGMLSLALAVFGAGAAILQKRREASDAIA